MLRLPFPPLPGEHALVLSMPEVLIRVATDTAGTLDGRLITVKGFTLKDGEHTDLAGVVIICCAADARLARIHLDGPEAVAATTFPDETWVSVEGMVPPGQGESSGRSVPTLNVSRIWSVDPPANPYAD